MSCVRTAARTLGAVTDFVQRNRRGKVIVRPHREGFIYRGERESLVL